jgi:hypothetical protein
MDKLEQHIRSRKGEFDSFEPAEGHFDRFAGKLHPGRTSLFSRIPYAVKVAAVLLLVAASSILIYEQVNQVHIKRDFAGLNDISREFSDIESYYTSLINEKYRAIDDFTSDNPEQNRILINELELMDNMFKSLQQDFQANPMDERIIHAMITHYELKLEIMGQILTQLENVQQINKNNNSDESTEI